MKRKLKIAIIGEVNNGKSALEYAIITQLQRLGINVDWIPDIDYKNYGDFVSQMERRGVDLIKGLQDTEISIETIQAKHN